MSQLIIVDNALKANQPIIVIKSVDDLSCLIGTRLPQLLRELLPVIVCADTEIADFFIIPDYLH